MPLEEAGAEKAFAAEKSIAAVRLAVITHGSLVYHFVMDQSGTIQWLSYLLLALAWVYSLYVYLLEPYRRYPIMLSSYFISVTDTLFMAAWLYATGGVESPFYVVLYGAVIAIAFRYSARETMIAAVIYSASYLVLLAVLGQLAGHLTEITVRVGYVFLVAAAGALFAREALQQTQAKLELRDLTQRLELEVSERKRAEEALFRLNEALEEEAKRSAHAIHDNAGQLLAMVHIALAEAARELPPPADQRLHGVKELLDQIEEQLRRLSHELRPTILDDLGLLPALEFLAEGVSKRTGLPVTVEGATVGRLPSLIETTLYRIVQQALTNVTKHAQATRASVQLQREAHMIHCSIRDDGIGFDAPTVLGRRGERGLGLIGIRERLNALGGALQINSAPGRGTELRITVPLTQ